MLTVKVHPSITHQGCSSGSRYVFVSLDEAFKVLLMDWKQEVLSIGTDWYLQTRDWASTSGVHWPDDVISASQLPAYTQPVYSADVEVADAVSEESHAPDEVEAEDSLMEEIELEQQVADEEAKFLESTQEQTGEEIERLVDSFDEGETLGSTLMSLASRVFGW